MDGTGSQSLDLLAMVVDSEPVFQMNLETELEGCGCRLLQFRDSREATSALRDGVRPDLAIVEVVWPQMHGLSLAQWLDVHVPEAIVVATTISDRALRACEDRLPSRYLKISKLWSTDRILEVARNLDRRIASRDEETSTCGFTDPR